MGVNLGMWRLSIGMFNIKSACHTHVEGNAYPLPLDHFLDMLSSLAGSMPFVSLFGLLLKVLAHSVMVISFLFMFLTLYPLFKFLCDEAFVFCLYPPFC